MVRSLTAGVSGIEQFQTKMDVIGNNIANSSTVGFKGARADFEDTFNETLLSAGQSKGSPSMQVGSGVGTSGIHSLFTQGTLDTTHQATDLGISGDGFFVVKDSAGGGEYATRAGDFSVNKEGYLVTSEGYRVQGFNDPGLSTIGDLKIDASVRPSTVDANAKMQGFSIDEHGQIKVRLADGTDYVRGQVLLQQFKDPNALVKEGNNLYSGMVAAGALGGGSPVPAAAGTNGLGTIQSGTLEMSNVDLTTEFAELISTQRGFQANARIITTTDELLQEVVNLKR